MWQIEPFKVFKQEVECTFSGFLVIPLDKNKLKIEKKNFYFKIATEGSKTCYIISHLP